MKNKLFSILILFFVFNSIQVCCQNIFNLTVKEDQKKDSQKLLQDRKELFQDLNNLKNNKTAKYFSLVGTKDTANDTKDMINILYSAVIKLNEYTLAKDTAEENEPKTAHSIIGSSLIGNGLHTFSVSPNFIFNQSVNINNSKWNLLVKLCGMPKDDDTSKVFNAKSIFVPESQQFSLGLGITYGLFKEFDDWSGSKLLLTSINGYLGFGLNNLKYIDSLQPINITKKEFWGIHIKLGHETIVVENLLSFYNYFNYYKVGTSNEEFLKYFPVNNYDDFSYFDSGIKLNLPLKDIDKEINQAQDRIALEFNIVWFNDKLEGIYQSKDLCILIIKLGFEKVIF